MIIFAYSYNIYTDYYSRMYLYIFYYFITVVKDDFNINPSGYIKIFNYYILLELLILNPFDIII